MAAETTVDGSPTNGSNPWLDSLVWGGAWAADGGSGTPVISYALPNGNDPYGVHGGGKKWSSAETKALEAAMKAWEAVANIDFVRASSAATADIWYWLNDDDDSLGWHEVPGYSSGEPLYGVFNHRASVWNAANLAKGGYSYVTLLHELGHGLGLAHPHDGGDDGELFPGVSAPFDDYGDHGLNQGIWTTMSYNDGWDAAQSRSYAYGWQATPMALDIAAIQLIYGANTTYNAGGNTYTLPTANKAGTGWSAIWDNGGIDTLSASTATKSVTINLNDATLAGANGGGFVSRMAGVYGGFTIANGVVIENAVGGKAADVLIGNEWANTLSGAAGNDELDGGDGNDTLVGGLGRDDLWGGDGGDRFRYDAVAESVPKRSGWDRIHDFESGSDLIDLSAIDAKAGFTRSDSFVFIGSSAALVSANANGAVWFDWDAGLGSGFLHASTDKDLAAEFKVELVGVSTFDADDLVA